MKWKRQMEHIQSSTFMLHVLLAKTCPQTSHAFLRVIRFISLFFPDKTAGETKRMDYSWQKKRSSAHFLFSSARSDFLHLAPTELGSTFTS